MRKKLAPIKLKTNGKSAWMYMNERSIEVYIQYEEGKNPVMAKVLASQLTS